MVRDSASGAKPPRPTVRVTIRYDAEVLAAFRATGPGWQARMNAALVDWLKTHTPDELRT